MSKKRSLSREEDENIWIIPAALAAIISLGSAIYLVYLKSIGVIASDNLLFLYGFVFWFPVSMAICFGTYEVLSSLRISRPFRFHLKRFLFRTLAVLGYGLYTVALYDLLSSLVVWRYAILLSFIVTSVTLAALVLNPRIRNLIQKFSEGD